MSKEVQILLVEDNDADAMLMGRVLRQAGLCAICRRVQAQAEFERQLRLRQPDLIVCEYGLRCFDGFVALDVAQRQCPEVPFIFVTNSSDVRLFIEMIESGAADCVNKRCLKDLGPAALGALREAEYHQRQQRLSDPITLLRPGAETRSTAPAPPQPRKSLPFCADCKKLLNESGQWEPIEVYLQRHSDVTVAVSLCTACARKRQASGES